MIPVVSSMAILMVLFHYTNHSLSEFGKKFNSMIAPNVIPLAYNSVTPIRSPSVLNTFTSFDDSVPKRGGWETCNFPLPSTNSWRHKLFIRFLACPYNFLVRQSWLCIYMDIIYYLEEDISFIPNYFVIHLWSLA